MTTVEREQTRQAWDGIASRYDEFVTPSHMWLAEQGLRYAGLCSGMRFLDVAAGSGALAIPAARMGAHVLATDQSPLMLERLKARRDQEGLSIQVQAMDGQALNLEDNTFDMAGSQFGVMLFPDMPRGIREMARVVKPGGRVLLHAYGNPAEIEFLAFFVRAVQAVRPAFSGLPLDPPPLPLQLQNPDRLYQEFTAAGLHNVQVTTISETLHFPTGHALWNWLHSSNPIVDAVLGELGIAPGERDAMKGILEELVRDRAGNTGRAELTNPIHIGIGTK